MVGVRMPSSIDAAIGVRRCFDCGVSRASRVHTRSLFDAARGSLDPLVEIICSILRIIVPNVS
jgi:hypothetical protein